MFMSDEDEFLTVIFVETMTVDSCMSQVTWQVLVVWQVVAFLCGYVHYHSESSASKKIPFQPWNINMWVLLRWKVILCGNLTFWSIGFVMCVVVFGWGCRGESEWWIFPAGLVVCKIMQSQLINRHVANLEIQDRSLYSKDFELFWQSWQSVLSGNFYENSWKQPCPSLLFFFLL